MFNVLSCEIWEQDIRSQLRPCLQATIKTTIAKLSLVQSISSITSSDVQPFCAPPCNSLPRTQLLKPILQRISYQYHPHFDLPKILQIQQNLPIFHQQSFNSSDDDIWLRYQNVVNYIRQNCRMHLHNMICQMCKDVNWVLEGGRSQSPWMMYEGYFVQTRHDTWGWWGKLLLLYILHLDNSCINKWEEYTLFFSHWARGTAKQTCAMVLWR